MDIKKFFNSVDHDILLRLLQQRIDDLRLLKLLEQIIQSFEFSPGKGMPLGNLTSQLFANVYMDPLDKFVKHRLKAKYYLRYADDFLILSPDRDELSGFFIEIDRFLKTNLSLRIHPDKIIMRKLSWGIDFVGYVALPHYNLPRSQTTRRIIRKVSNSNQEDLQKSLPSFLGYFGHVNSYKEICGLLESARK